MALVDNYPTGTPTWNNWPSTLFKQVLTMIQTNENKQLMEPFYRSDFGNHDYRRPLSVQIATPARIMFGDPDILLMWINHHGSMSIFEFAKRLDVTKPKLQDHLGRHFLTALLDFGFYPDRLETAKAKPEDPIVVPESPTSPASSGPGAAAPRSPKKGNAGVGAEGTRSSAQRALGEPSSSSTASLPKPQTPVVMQPVGWWQGAQSGPKTPVPGKRAATTSTIAPTSSTASTSAREGNNSAETASNVPAVASNESSQSSESSYETDALPLAQMTQKPQKSPARSPPTSPSKKNSCTRRRPARRHRHRSSV